MNTFETSLLTELREHVETRGASAPPKASHPRRRRVAWTAVPVGGVTAVALGLVLAQSPAAAYAVDKASNGDVVVTIDKLSDAAGLQQALRADGINAAVSYDATLAPTTRPAPPSNPGAAAGSRSTTSGHGLSRSTTQHGSRSLSGSGQGSSTQQSGCGSLGPISVAMSAGAVTFTIPAADVGTGSTLSITTGGSQASGLAAVQIHWNC